MADCVDEISVVGNQNNGWRIGTSFPELEKESLQPNDAEEVKEIGRFVEDQDVSWLEQNTCKIGAHFPSSRQGGDFFVKVGFGKAEAR